MTQPTTSSTLIEDEGWQEFNPDPVGGIDQECVWQCQFCRTPRARRFLWGRSLEPGGEAKLQAADINWAMEIERNELTLLRCEPLAGQRPSSGGTRCWFIRAGKYITLAEMFRMGRRPCTCFDLHGAYCLLPTIIFKRKHGETRAPQGTKRNNAKVLRHSESGRYGLPALRANPKRRGGR